MDMKPYGGQRDPHQNNMSLHPSVGGLDCFHSYCEGDRGNCGGNGWVIGVAVKFFDKALSPLLIPMARQY